LTNTADMVLLVIQLLIGISC